MSNYIISRRIEVDAGHRIMTHGSKCRHLHGHRYVVEARARAVAGELQSSGEQTGMVLDFGFLKEEMLNVIDLPCDHGFIASIEDLELLRMFCPEGRSVPDWIEALAESIEAVGFALTEVARLNTKLYVIAGQPTAENLAKHWFEMLAPKVSQRSQGHAELMELQVWETPNCWAVYSG